MGLGIPPLSEWLPASMRLRFPEHLEADYQRSHARTARRIIQLSLAVALFSSLGFAVIDYSELTHASRAPEFVRFGLQLPLLVVCLLSTNDRFYDRWFGKLALAGSVLFGCGTVVMVSTAVPEQAALVGARLLLVTFFVYFLLGLGVRAALLSNVAILGALLLATRVVDFAPAVAAYLSFSLFCANIIGLGGAYALERANRLAFLERRRLEEVADTDGLTGLLNRQAFESRIRAIWRASADRGRSVAVIMIDIDHFKPFNDQLGHQAGDDCLRRVAAAVRAVVGHSSGRFVARYGGEELVAVVGPAEDAEALRLAQSIVSAVAAMAIEHPASDTARHVTVSVGAATQQASHDASHDHSVKVADRALYTAKRHGRNRCVTVTMPVAESVGAEAASAG